MNLGKWAQWLVAKGIAKDTQQANYFVLGGALLVIVVSIFFVLSTLHGAPKPPAPSITGSIPSRP